MSHAPAPAPAPAGSIRPRSGLLLAAVIFIALFGGYLALRAADRGDDLAAPLPGAALPTGPCTLWFVGSSTIARWATLHDDMKPWDAHGRGVNGALIPALTRRLDNDTTGPAPASIVFYAGENDIAAGADAPHTLRAFDAFMAAKTRRYGPLPVIALSLKPSPARLAQLAEQTAFNRGLSDRARARRDLHYVEIRPLMIVDRRPGPFYVEDGLHMNAAGYARWTPRILSAAAAAVAPATRAACVGRRRG